MAHECPPWTLISQESIGATTDEERIAATWALTAYQRFQMGDYDGSVAAFKRGVEIAPNFPRVYRNWAVVEDSAGYHARANELMEKATKRNVSIGMRQLFQEFIEVPRPAARAAVG